MGRDENLPKGQKKKFKKSKQLGALNHLE